MYNEKSKGSWYVWIIRIMAFCLAPVLWYVSFNFSVRGFAYFLPEWIWVGQIFGIVFTVLELMFNRGLSKHPTLFYAGIFAYVYSIGTNILGLFSASDLSSIHGAMFVLSSFMLIILAFGLDILPESMLVWSLYPDEPIITGDFLSSIMNGARRGGGGNKNFQSYQQPQQRQQTPQSLPKRGRPPVKPQSKFSSIMNSRPNSNNIPKNNLGITPDEFSEINNEIGKEYHQFVSRRY